MAIREVDTQLSDRINAAGIKTFATLDFTCVEVRLPCGEVLRGEVESGHSVDLHNLWKDALELHKGSKS